ncbi:MAG: (2Fe-2S) ferredoxin domain-containing protein [Chloroflexi bacterium]|nr:(2Fe-2S) ferredoxin domain-containing protein [Chloroflexota bacterium]
MLTIVVCVGSSCYVRGSDKVAETFERLLSEEGLAGKAELVGSFCMDACSMGVSVRVGDEVFRGVSPEAAEQFFYDQIKPRLVADAEA